jgi:hypothetical protein
MKVDIKTNTVPVTFSADQIEYLKVYHGLNVKEGTKTETVYVLTCSELEAACIRTAMGEYSGAGDYHPEVYHPLDAALRGATVKVRRKEERGMAPVFVKA